MGKVLSVVAGKVQRFNIENRAQRVISKDKPTVAPTFESNKKDLERVLREFPEIVEQAGKKDAGLDDRLKKVFVTSSDFVEPIQQADPNKPLPLSRTTVADYELGFQEPELKKIAPGKCTLRQAIQFISEHQQNPDEWTTERIANEFKLKPETVCLILEHFRMFAIHIPQKEERTKKYLIDPFHGRTKNFNELLANMKGETKPEDPAAPPKQQ